ncbi:hypothetical protein SALGADO_44 [Arthrobacter phage Salgado]|uniref:Uncharacterized protein n=1 Tax=Arthrobacter phage Salgado TaxID=1772314 RepID=A0A0U4JJS4_9CAUD|nr:hypothetical protein KMD22_gp44 [Arthrobacter phage Salgado]ALY10212.1 hypothetical protein SALGADO_44 [Arthrobacter phage Salgado]
MTYEYTTAEEVVRAWSMANRAERQRVAEASPSIAARLNSLRASMPEVRDAAMLEANHAVPRPDTAPIPARFNVLAAAAGESGWEAHPEAPADTPDGATELVTVDWAIVKATGQVLYYFSEVEARRAYRTEHGRKIMVRIPGGHMWRVIA